MNTNDEINKKIESTIRAFDNEPELQPNPFLMTRILAEQNERIEKEHRPAFPKFNLRIVLMLFLLLVNLLTMYYYIVQQNEVKLQENLILNLRSEMQLDQPQETF